jgi:hypothetical protein
VLLISTSVLFWGEQQGVSRVVYLLHAGCGDDSDGLL